MLRHLLNVADQYLCSCFHCGKVRADIGKAPKGCGRCEQAWYCNVVSPGDFQSQSLLLLTRTGLSEGSLEGPQAPVQALERGQNSERLKQWGQSRRARVSLERLRLVFLLPRPNGMWSLLCENWGEAGEMWLGLACCKYHQA